MANLLNELKNLSETLQNRNIALPKAHISLTAYAKQIKSFIASLGKRFILARRAEKTISFQEVELREGNSSVIN